MGLKIQSYVVLRGIKGNIAGLCNNQGGTPLSGERGESLFCQVDI